MSLFTGQETLSTIELYLLRPRNSIIQKLPE